MRIVQRSEVLRLSTRRSRGRMTQVESTMEEKQKSANVNSTPPPDIKEKKLNNVSEVVKRNSSSTKISSPRVSRATKTIKVHLNGENQQSVQIIPMTLDRITDFSEVLEELSRLVSYPGSILKVFTLRGKRVNSTGELQIQDEVVVCGEEAFKMLPYGQGNQTLNQMSQSQIQARPQSIATKLRRTDRAALAKSVILEPTSMTEESHGNSLLKTFSEQDVSNIHTPLKDNSQLSNSMIRHSQYTPRPRPVSSYQGSSIPTIIEKKTMTPILTSRIPVPKRNLLTNLPNQNSPALNSTAMTTSASGKLGGFTPKKPEKDKTNSGERTSRHDASRREFIRPRLVTIIRMGMKPRKATRFLLNKKTARSFDQVLNDITESIKPDWGAVRKVYALTTKEITSLEGFFGDEDIFLACANDRVTPDDFDLDSEECKSIQPYVKVSLASKQVKLTRGLETSKSPQRRPKSSSNSQGVSSAYPSHPKYIPLTHFPTPILERYFVGHVIGDGNFAVVRECTDRVGGQKFALKVIDKSKCSGRDAPPEHEVTILNMVRHPNIILLYEQYDFSNELYVVMELVDGGDLFDAIAEATKFPEEESASMTRDIASALSFLHSLKIVHRDIKPENLLVFIENDGNRRIKLGDFGLAQIVSGPLYTVCGTPTYVAPEILAESGYGLKVDVWALGVIVYVLLCGYPPFISPTGEQEDLFDLILAGEYDFPPEHWVSISDDAKDIIGRMIDSDTDLRLCADEVLEHPWLAKDAEESNERRSRLYHRDFQFSVYEKLGIAKSLPIATSPVTANIRAN